MTKNFADWFFGAAIFLQQAFLAIITAGSVADHIVRADRRLTVSINLLRRTKRETNGTNVSVPFVAIDEVGLLKRAITAFGFIDERNMRQDTFFIHKPVEVLR